ncbi:hypothetical protein SPRG_16298 [Saprolegnia parasitica CBS 223.65]|uniref:Uncharacterized protein n=1 Tax=Saprolegnia parasitica (strain CBS 223.65) TaxID=695850 RepID=A0A067BJG7_SAPPC|nr:hypothetical protein SPRG_16298 [Saprolegnia parasitica CBS 223.65]KDO18308.1 hypothetical protein SPRG_16298 [Saprolegnia parasitica CBS 223.65]|eukprot:XP_012210983.1 hypothetical protein SPRG_16298 [Saprolegnia parasitica CBS 223.65]
MSASSSNNTSALWLAHEHAATEAMALRSALVVFGVLATLFVFVAVQRRRLDATDALKYANAVRKAQFERVSHVMKKHRQPSPDVEVELAPLMDEYALVHDDALE